MKIHHSALKHGIEATDILHALDHRAYEAEPSDEIPSKQFVMGWDGHGRLLEIFVLTFDSGNQLVIHAMKARRSYLHLLD